MPDAPLVFNRSNGVTGAVWRDGGVIRKTLRSRADAGQWAPGVDPRHWNFWRREAEAYVSGLPGRLRLAAPELLELREAEDGLSLEMALQPVGGRTLAALDLADLVAVAEALGRSQGSATLPQDPWLSRRFLPGYIAVRPVDYGVSARAELWQHPLIAQAFDSRLREELRALPEHTAALLEILSILPRTVAHLDVFPGNLFVTEDGPVLIDWGFAGDAALGEEIGNLVPDTLFDLFHAPDAAEDLAEALPAAYLRGLRASGWAGDARLVELGIKASAVRYIWMTPLTLLRAQAPEQTTYGGALAPDPALNYRGRAAGLRLCARWSREALALATRLRAEGVLPPAPSESTPSPALGPAPLPAPSIEGHP